nr:LOW QUALITY PROTEIN: uncharacterized protein LOC112428794 [Macaca nemestrina]
MVRASRAPGRAAEGGGRAPDTADACRARSGENLALLVAHPGRTGQTGSTVRGFYEFESLLCRPTNLNRTRAGAAGSPASFQCSRLASRRAVSPAASAALGLSGTLPRLGAGASVPGAPPPRDKTSPERFPKQTQCCSRTHTHTHTHTHNAPRGAHSRWPARPRFRCARSDPPSLSSGEGGSLRGTRGTPRKGEAASRLRAAGAGLVPGHRGSRRVGGEARGVSERRAQGGRRSGWRVGPL